MVRLWLLVTTLVATSTGESDMTHTRRELGHHYTYASTFTVDGHTCYKAGCEKYDKHLHAWVKDPHCCAFTNGFAGRDWARCSSGLRRSTARALDFEYIFKGQFHVGNQCVGTATNSAKLSHIRIHDVHHTR